MTEPSTFEGEGGGPSQVVHNGRTVAWAPNPGPQTLLLTCPVKDVFFGGARAGGKTWGLLGAWLQHASRWGGKARGIFFRKTYKQMDEVIERSRKIFPMTGATYASSEYTWRWPSGASIRFRYLDKDSDADEYQGHEWNFVAYDELTNWPTPKPIDMLRACLRSSEGVACISRSTGNPGGPGTKWVKERYIKGRIPGEVFDLVPNPKRPDLKVQAVFIPSKIEDNPKIYLDDPSYESNLALSAFGDEARWKAWRLGDWDALIGQYFERFNEVDNVYDPRAVELSPWMPKWVSVDWGYTHPSAVYWYTWDGTNIWVHRELVRANLTPEELANEIAAMSFGETIDAVYLSPDAYGRKTSERTIAQEMSDVFRTFNIPEPTPADNDRVGGAMLLQQMFGEKRLMISANCPKLIECIPMCQRDDGYGKDPEDVAKFDGDDPYDSLRYGVKTRPGSIRVPDEVVLARRMTASDPQSRFMQMRVAKAELTAKNAAVVSVRRSGNWRREMAAN